MYQVEFAESQVTEFTTNVIAESMYAQWNADVNEYLLLDVLVDYWKNNKAIFLRDQHITVRGRSVTHKTTVGWQICCQWKNGFTTWEKLFELKESHPVQTTEFAVAQEIDHVSSFN